MCTVLYYLCVNVYCTLLYCLCVNVTVLLPPVGYPIADNKYIYIYLYKYTKKNHLINTLINAHT